MNDIVSPTYPAIECYVIYNPVTKLFVSGGFPSKFGKKPRIYFQVSDIKSYIWQVLVEKSYKDNAYFVKNILRDCVVYSLIDYKVHLDIYEYILSRIARDKKHNPYFKDFAIIEQT